MKILLDRWALRALKTADNTNPRTVWVKTYTNYSAREQAGQTAHETETLNATGLARTIRGY